MKPAGRNNPGGNRFYFRDHRNQKEVRKLFKGWGKNLKPSNPDISTENVLQKQRGNWGIP